MFSAAVADYRPAERRDQKIKREGVETQTIELVRNPDIAARCGDMKRQGQISVGFALETDDGHDAAHTKLHNKNLDFVVLNSLKDKGAGFRTDTNRVTIVSENGEQAFPLKSKREVAADIVDAIEKAMK